MTERGAAPGSTSRSLLDDARHADPIAWRRLVLLYAPLVAGWCRRSGIAEQDVLDVMQEVFAAVANNLDRFRKDRPSDTFRGWLLAITRHQAVDAIRRRSREPAGAGGTEAWKLLEEVPAGAAAVVAAAAADPVAEGDGFADVLRRALDSIRAEFAESTWRAFWGVAVDGRTAADVGADLGMRPGTVRVAKSRVLMRLRRELGDLG